MTETNTQISVYDALLRDEPTILVSVRNATSKLLTQTFAFANRRDGVCYLQALRAFMDAIGFPGPNSYVFLNMTPAELDVILGERSAGILLDLLPDRTAQVVITALDTLSVTGAQIADCYPRCAYALALNDLEATLRAVTP